MIKIRQDEDKIKQATRHDKMILDNLTEDKIRYDEMR